MIKADLWHEIHSRHKLKESKKSIARALGLHILTVRRILRQSEPKPYKRLGPERTVITPYKDYILQRLAAVGYCAQAIFEELRARGYKGSYDAVKRFVSPLRKEANLEATMRFETPPGRQGQADWGQCWTTIEGKKMKVHLFVLTLGFSRRMYAAATADEKMPAFLRSHEEAFDFLGGVPHEIVYDNLKSVVLGRDFEGSRSSGNSAGITASGRGLTDPTGRRPRARSNRASNTSSGSSGARSSEASIISMPAFSNGS